MVEPLRADTMELAGSDSLQHRELAAMVRLWLEARAKVHERVRRDGSLRLAPAPVDQGRRQELGQDVRGTSESVKLVEPRPPAQDQPRALPVLPRRPMGEDAERVRRIALLVDARRVSADVATGLLALLDERGSLGVCRAYADWSRSEPGAWAQRLRRQGLHSFHHFSDDDDQALVAMAIDAVDIARDTDVDDVVIAGDLTSALPLVHRLHAAGVRVVGVGAGHTPHDVRAACDEFLDTGAIDGTVVVPQGRHRA